MDHYCVVFFFQAEDGIRDLVRSRGLGDVYKRQALATLNLGLGFEAGISVVILAIFLDRLTMAIGQGLSLIHI